MSLLIRACNPLDDVDEIVNLILENFAQEDFPFPRPNKEAIKGGVYNFLHGDPQEHIMFLAIQDRVLVGLVGAAKVQHPFFHELYLAKEAPFYVTQCKNRGMVWMKLYDTFIDWAKKVGCEQVHIGSTNSKLSGIYEKKGMKPISVTYMKDLTSD